MKLLIIGNGFDIEHGLRTKYTQFMNFAKWCTCIDSESESDKYEINREDYDIYQRLLSEKTDLISELKENIKDNQWIKYFNKILNQREDTWIDFETEIAFIMKVFDKERRSFFNKTSFNMSYEDTSREFKQMFRELTDKRPPDFISGIYFDDIKKELLTNLKKLTRALEIYMKYWVDDAMILNMNPDIARIHPDKIISFNYTHTFERVYKKSSYDTEYCYIHGEAKENSIENNNMVLGIDDDLDDKKEDGYLLEYKKYFQRLNLNTDISYKKWISEISSYKNDTSEIYIFGHSLDITDKEIFEPLLNIENAKITVYCYDKVARSKLISNVIKIIGKYNAISKISSREISFVLQAKSKKIKNSEIDIKSDIYDLYNLNSLSFDQIRLLLDKVKNNIDEQNYEYFNELEYVISVVDALALNNLCTIIDKKYLIAIIEKIASIKNYDYDFCCEDWLDFTHENQPFYREATKKIINEVNSIISKHKGDKRNDKFKKIFNDGSIDYKDMDCKYYLDTFKKAYKYFDNMHRFDDEAIKYMKSILNSNSMEAEKAIKLLKNDIGNGDYPTPYGEIFYTIMQELISYSYCDYDDI